MLIWGFWKVCMRGGGNNVIYNKNEYDRLGIG